MITKKNKIDRAFFNVVWENTRVWSLKPLPRKNSNHRGLLVSLSDFNWGPKSFRVFNVWIQNDSLKKAINSNLRVEDSADAQSVLRKVRDIIRSWIGIRRTMLISSRK